MALIGLAMGNPDQRVVITGVGVVSPLGSDARAMVQALRSGTSGVAPLTRLPQGSALGINAGAEATEG